MKYHNWNEDKNNLLKKERGISFEEIIFCLENDNVIKIIEHPNTKKYPNQKMYVIDYNNYYYLVPFVETEEEIFLKTIIPSRKTKKKYSGGNKDES